jgi:membrane associated rhomboid family serine protease
VSDQAWVTRALIAVNVVVFALTWLVGDAFTVRLILVGRAWDGFGWIGVATGPQEWYRLLTAVFLHHELWHIGFNMLSLWWLGPPLEQALGRSRFLALYLLSGLGGSALSFLMASPGESSLGASGAIFGLLGATVVLHRRRGYDLRSIIALLVVNLVLTFTWGAIDWRAHIGGLVTGVVTAFGLVHAPPQRRAMVQGAVLAGVLGVVILLVGVGVIRDGG